MSDLDYDALRKVASILPDDIEHEGDCAGSLCPACGHCLHSIEECDHACTPESGCHTSIDFPEMRFRRDVLRLLDLAQRAEADRAAVERVRGLPQVILNTVDPLGRGADVRMQCVRRLRAALDPKEDQ